MILEQLKEIIDEKLIYEGELSPETRLVEDLGADSFDVPQLVDAVEEQFGIHINDHELPDIKTIGDIITLIEQKR